MIGVGIDIVAVQDFRKKKYTKTSALLRKCFSEQEIRYCFAKKDPAQHLAARFAAKEAAWKALPESRKTAVHLCTFLKLIEIRSGDDGAPHVIFSGIVKKHKALVSLSHTRALATAVVLLQK